MLVSRTLLAVITCQFESAEHELVVLPVISPRQQDLGLIGPPDRKTPVKTPCGCFSRHGVGVHGLKITAAVEAQHSTHGMMPVRGGD